MQSSTAAVVSGVGGSHWTGTQGTVARCRYKTLVNIIVVCIRATCVPRRVRAQTMAQTILAYQDEKRRGANLWNAAQMGRDLPLSLAVSERWVCRAMRAALCNDHVGTVATFVHEAHNIIDVPYTLCDVTLEHGWTPLTYAAHHGSVGAVHLLLNAKVSVHGSDSCFEFPLHCAVRQDHTTVMRLLLLYKADVDAVESARGRRNWCDTPLTAAARFRHAAAVQMLLDAKADVNKLNGNNFTALTIAADHGDIDVARTLVAAKAQFLDKRHDHIHWAAANGHLPLLALLISAKAGVNNMTRRRTPLSFAAERGRARVVKRLLAAKADAQLANEHGITPWTYAQGRGDARILQLLRPLQAPAPASAPAPAASRAMADTL